MELNLILLLICVAALAGAVGFQIAALMYQAIFADMLEKLGVTEEQIRKLGKSLGEELGQDTSMFDEDNSDLPTVHIKIEKHNDTLYAFRKDNDEFMGQGSTKEELIMRLAEKQKEIRLIVDRADGADYVGGHYTVGADGKIKE